MIYTRGPSSQRRDDAGKGALDVLLKGDLKEFCEICIPIKSPLTFDYEDTS